MRIISHMGDKRANQILRRLKKRCMYKEHRINKQVIDFSPNSQNTIHSIISSRLTNPKGSEKNQSKNIV
jgi:hypothetical protein